MCDWKYWHDVLEKCSQLMEDSRIIQDLMYQVIVQHLHSTLEEKFQPSCTTANNALDDWEKYLSLEISHFRSFATSRARGSWGQEPSRSIHHIWT